MCGYTCTSGDKKSIGGIQNTKGYRVVRLWLHTFHVYNNHMKRSH